MCAKYLLEKYKEYHQHWKRVYSLFIFVKVVWKYYLYSISPFHYVIFNCLYWIRHHPCRVLFLIFFFGIDNISCYVPIKVGREELYHSDYLEYMHFISVFFFLFKTYCHCWTNVCRFLRIIFLKCYFYVRFFRFPFSYLSVTLLSLFQYIWIHI